MDDTTRNEWRQTLDSAEMAALCALCARRGLPSPYVGTGWDSPDRKSVKALEDVAAKLMQTAESLWEASR